MNSTTRTGWRFRDATRYWNCLAQEYNAGRQQKHVGTGFHRAHRRASVLPSGRIFGSSLVDYLSMQFPNVDADDHMTTANNAIALAQEDIVTAFIKHKAASK